MKRRGLPVLLDKVMRLHEVLGLPSVNLMPGRLWTVAVDAHWFLVLNANGEVVTAGPPSGMTVPIHPYSCGCWFNGFYAGEFDHRGGVLAAGSLANEDALIAALTQAIDLVKA